ncbi:MAG: hypothetical protein ACYDAO_02445 [Thermoplasmataceae archaeon]
MTTTLDEFRANKLLEEILKYETKQIALDAEKRKEKDINKFLSSKIPDTWADSVHISGNDTIIIRCSGEEILVVLEMLKSIQKKR